MNNQQVNALLSALVFLTGAVLLSVEGANSYRSLGELTMGLGGLLLLVTWIRMNRGDGQGPNP
ncbi:MAG: hypothetical protein ISQ11_02520 [Planctomycetes bacterium]|nr:hypothetical protein [Planctomycetota bacterium]